MMIIYGVEVSNVANSYMENSQVKFGKAWKRITNLSKQ
jgi:hypothetical protein